SCTGLSPADPWDFDGDSFHEMALGSPGEDIDDITNAGAVNVIYGSKDGPVTEGDDLLYQDLSMVEGLSESGDRFGGAMTSGDFDRDGRADLVVSAPLDDVGNVVDAGLVNVIMGTSDGLGAADGQLWHRDTSGVIDVAGNGDRFGASLASGDFDGDGFFDLAIGVPRDRVNNQEGAGSVNVLYGTKTGLTAVGDQVWHQDSSGIVGVAGAGDRFGTSLAVGDFDNDGYDDLAIGAPGDVIGSANGAGQIHIIYGSSQGLTASGNDRFHQDSSGILEVAGTNDRFGHALAAADFDGDGYDDIAVGAPKDDADGKRNVGKVHILFGASGGVTSSGNELWSQSSSGVGDQPQAFDKFGATLAAADFDDDGFGDLAVGTPGEDIAGEKNTGAVTVIYGRSSGLKARSNNFLRQGANGLVGIAEAWDKFGATLRAVDVDGNNRWDLIVGMPGEDLSEVDAGAAILILGHNTGLNLNSSSVWHQNSPGIAGTVEAGDGFGKM
ncbi:MAG: hypothetical protein HKN91_18300, partial [Acidimicrobiia bacterium]|nr:hypothetical protein [Acidimicrobiia bacterium]